MITHKQIARWGVATLHQQAAQTWRFPHMGQLCGLATATKPNNCSLCSPRVFTTLMSWALEVCGHRDIRFRRHTLHLCCFLLHAYLHATTPSPTRDRLQLCLVATMWVAAKMVETRAPPCAAGFAALCDGAYTTKEVVQCERDVVFRLSTHLLTDTADVALESLLALHPQACGPPHTARQVLDALLLHMQSTHTPPMLLAATAICLARASSSLPLWSRVLARTSKCSLAQASRVMLDWARAGLNTALRNKEFATWCGVHFANLPYPLPVEERQLLALLRPRSPPKTRSGGGKVYDATAPALTAKT